MASSKEVAEQGLETSLSRAPDLQAPFSQAHPQVRGTPTPALTAAWPLGI